MRFYIFADLNVNVATYDWKLVHAPENFPDHIYGSPIEQNKAFAYNIHMQKEMNRGGSLSFTIGPDHPLKNLLFPLGTTICVKTSCEYDNENDTYTGGHVIWFGRVLTIEKNFNLERNVNCEGALAFLNDIMFRPRKFFVASGADEGKKHAISALELAKMVFDEYNQRAAVKRRIASSMVVTPVEDVAETTTELYDGCTTNPITVNGESVTATEGNVFKYGNTSYMYQTDMNNQNAAWYTYVPKPGYIADATYVGSDEYATTYDKLNEIVSLDPVVGMWVECTDDEDYDLTLYFAYLPWRYNHSKILFAQNLTDFTDNGDGMDIYNVLIPFGTNKLRLNMTSSSDSIQRIYSSNGAYMYDVPVSDSIGTSDQYGYIEKTIDLSDADDSASLSYMAQQNLDAYRNRNGRSFNVSAVQVSLLSENQNDGYNELLLSDMLSADYDPNNFINIGDGVYFVSTPHGESRSRYEFTCVSLEMDIDNPGATNFQFQIYDNNYIPLKPKFLTSYLDRKRAINEGKIASDGTIDYSYRQPTSVTKQDDNTVTADYDDHTEIWTAEGEGDTRTNIKSENVAKDRSASANTTS